MAFKAILYKNWKFIRKRNSIFTILLLETIVPILFFALLSLARTRFYGFSKMTLNASNTSAMDMGNLKSFLTPVDNWKLCTAPNGNIHREILKRVAAMADLPAMNIYNFQTRNKLFAYLNETNTKEVLYVVTFEHKIDKNIAYNISIVNNKYLKWDTDQMRYDKDVIARMHGYNPYIHEGFTALQILLDKAIIDTLSNIRPIIVTTLQEIPFPEDEIDDGLEFFFLTVLPLVTIFTLSFSIFFSVQLNMRRDQAAGVNELMVVNGVKMWNILLGWLLYHCFVISVTLIPIVVLLTDVQWDTPYKPIQYCSGYVLYIFLFFYAMAVVSFFLFLATVARSSTITYMAGIIIGLIAYFISFAITNPEETVLSFPGHLVLCIFCINLALQLGFEALAKCEIQKTSCSVFTSSGGDDLEIGHVILCLVIAIIFTNVMTLLVNTFYGFNRHTFWQTFWCKAASNKEHKPSSQESKPFSPDNSLISIRNLRKKYGVKVVLDIEELDIPKEEVTALLGLNGAGKSSLLSIISGTISFNEGLVKFSDRNKVQIGYCQQTDVLFDHLTVEEHLEFFAKIRISDSIEIKKEIEDILQRLDFTMCRGKQFHELSSIGKRKLCLAIALVGYPQLIILDEIICSFEQEIKENIFTLLKRKPKPDRSKPTIIIATHPADEIASMEFNNIILLNEGKCIFNRKTSDLVSTSNNDKTKYHISVLIDQLSNVYDAGQKIASSLKGIKILRREAKTFVLKVDGGQESEETVRQKLLDHKTEWHIESISSSGNGFNDLSRLMIEKINEQNPYSKVKLEDINSSGEDIQNLKSIFKNRDNGYKLSLLIKRWFYSSKYFLFNIPGMLIIMLFAMFAVYLTSEGRRYYEHQETPLRLHLTLFENKTVLYQLKNTKISNDLMNITMETRNKFNVTRHKVIQEITNKYRKRSAQFENDIVCGADFTVNGNNIQIQILHSPVYVHSAPTSINLAMNAVLRYLLNDSYSISTTNVPAKLQQTYFVQKEVKNESVFVLWTIFITAGLMFLFGDYLMFPYIDMSMEFNSFKISSILRSIWYWMLNLMFDVVHSTLKVSVIILFIFLLDNVFSKQPLFKFQEFVTLALILIASGIAKLPLCYLFGMFAGKCGLDQGYSLFIWFGIVTGLIPSLILATIDTSDYTNGFYSIIYILTCVFPHLAANFYLIYFCKKFVENYNWDNMDPNVRQFMCRTNSNPCCFAESLQCIEHRSYFLNKHFGINYSFLLPLIALLIWQGVAIRSFAILRGQAKRTAQRFMSKIKLEPKKIYGIYNTSDKGIHPNVQLQDFISLNKEVDIGFFPEDNQLIYWLSGLDLLILACLTRGYSLGKSRKAAKLLIDIFDLKELANVKCSSYSGGNKKRLQICIALVGFPDFAVVDNATNALDIDMSVKIWDVYLVYKEYTSKTILLGIPNVDQYKRMCDCSMDIAETQQDTRL